MLLTHIGKAGTMSSGLFLAGVSPVVMANEVKPPVATVYATVNLELIEVNSMQHTLWS